MAKLRKHSSARMKARFSRKVRVRKKIKGTPERPRLTVFRSARHIYAQIVDDVKGETLAAASTLTKDIGLKKTANKDAAKAVGAKLAEIAKGKGVTKVVFDRNGFIYHGRIAALADGAREAGLEL